MTVIVVYWLIGLIDWLVDIDTTNSYETTSQLQSDRLTGKPSTLLLFCEIPSDLSQGLLLLSYYTRGSEEESHVLVAANCATVPLTLLLALCGWSRR